MKRGSRVWRLYYGIQAAIWLSALGVFLGVRFLVKEAWELDIARPPSLLLFIALFLIKLRAESVAKAACRKAGLWQEAPRENSTKICVKQSLERVGPSELPTPEPTPLDLKPHSGRTCLKMAWVTTGLSALFVVMTS